MAEPFGATDCERIGEAFLSQPVNALTSLAFVVAGLVILRHRPDRRALAVAVSLVGFGSFAAHGPRWTGSEWLHDVTIAWVLVLVLVEGMRPVVAHGAVPGLGVLFAAAPVANDVVLVILAAGVVGRELLPGRRSAVNLRAVALLGAGALIGTLSRTGWPLCVPHSVLQGHAVWHLLAAGALAVWGSGAPRGVGDERGAPLRRGARGR